MKVAINSCHGGFGLSEIAEVALLRKKGFNDLFFYCGEINDKYDITGFHKISEKDFYNNDSYHKSILKKDFGSYVSIKDIDDDFYDSIISSYEYMNDRSDKDMIAVIEQLGEAVASDRFSNVKIIEIPDDVEYEIDNYDGIESIHEKHRVWGG